MYNYISNYKGRTDLVDLYGDNSLLLYALQLRYDIEDIISVASEALTDGSDDKKCDLIYIDRDSGFAVVAQAYMKKNPTETDLAKVNKASDLNTAASWIFTRDINDIPDRIKDSVSELQEAIKDGDINTVYFWYVHNMNEKNNPEVQEELNTVQIAAQKLVNNLAGDNSVKIVSLEVGNDTIERWYNSSSKRITIEEEIDVEGNGKAFEVKGGKWKSCVTAVKGSWIRKLYLMYKDDLFSGNPRNYLGAGKRKNKIILTTLSPDTHRTSEENLGLAYLTAVLRKRGYNVEIIDGWLGGLSDEEVLRRIEIGSYISQKEYSGKFYKKALQARSLIRDEINAMLENVDLIVGPTVPKLPHKIGDELTPMEMYAYDVLTVIANLAGIPAGSIKAGEVDSIPVGLQIQAKPLDDLKIIKAMSVFENEN